MKLALFDPYGGKFTSGMQRWWRDHGYEVWFDKHYDPKMVQWADVVFFYTCDNNIKTACYPDKSDRTQAGWDMHDMDLSGKKIIVQAVDIEVWQGHQNNVDWHLVDDIIFQAPHIQDLGNRFEGLRNGRTRQHVIQHGVDLEAWTFRERKPGYNIGLVSELWESKGTDLVPQIAYKLKQISPRYHLTWLGRWSEYEWDKAYLLDLIAREHLPLTLETDFVPSVDQWLEDKNYLLHASKKEAFSFATAEAMAKGIKPVLHHFYGADFIWPHITWNFVDEAVESIVEPHYDSALYRQYLSDHGYTLEQQMSKIERVIHG